jgi:hypothetical protein
MLQLREFEREIFGHKSFWRNGGDINAHAPPANTEVTKEILHEIAEFTSTRGNMFVMPEVYGQEDAAPSTVASAPTNEALRALNHIPLMHSDLIDDVDAG